MSCKNCTPADYQTRVRIEQWTRSGYDDNRVAAILGISLDLIQDVKINGVGEYTPPPVIETIITQQDMPEEENGYVPPAYSSPGVYVTERS